MSRKLVDLWMKSFFPSMVSVALLIFGAKHGKISGLAELIYGSVFWFSVVVIFNMSYFDILDDFNSSNQEWFEAEVEWK